MPDMKWHIYQDDLPLCWDDKALEFDTEIAAREFLLSAIKNSCFDDTFWVNAELKKDILFYDTGNLNATYLRVAWDNEKEDTVLINCN